MIIAPFLPGRGPAIEIEPGDSGVVTIADDTRGSWPGAGPVPPVGTVVFQWADYHPAASIRTDAAMAADIIGFCLAYVERPEEFDRRGPRPVVPTKPEVPRDRTQYPAYKRALRTYNDTVLAAHEWDAQGGPLDLEQEHAAFWRAYGESFQLDTDEED